MLSGGLWKLFLLESGGSHTMTYDGSSKKTAPKKSTEPGQFVRDAQAKLTFFYKGSINLPKGGRLECVHRFSFSSRAGMASEIPAPTGSTLSEAQLKGTGQGAEHLSKTCIAALAKYLGFDPTWKEWLSGSAEEFGKRYNKDNTFCRQLFRCQQEGKAFAPDPQLAVLKLRSTTNSPNLPWPLNVELTCDVSPEDDLSLCIHHARIVVQIGDEGQTVPLADRKSFPNDYAGVPGSAPDLTITPHAGDQPAVWILRAGLGIAGTISLAGFIEVVSIEDGGVVEAMMLVYVKDIKAARREAPSQIELQERKLRKGETHSIRWQAQPGASTTLSAAREKIEQRLAVLERQERDAIPASDLLERLYDGWIVVARDRMKFEAIKTNNGERE